MVGVRHRRRPRHRRPAGGDLDRRPAVDGAAAPRRWRRRRPCWPPTGTRTYVIWGGQRSRIDPARPIGHVQPRSRPGHDVADRDLQRAVRRHAGHRTPCGPGDSGGRHPVAVAARARRWAACWRPGTPTGTVSGFYVLLPGGVQKITSFVADLLRTANVTGSVAPLLVSPGQAGQHPDSRRARRRLLPRRASSNSLTPKRIR